MRIQTNANQTKPNQQCSAVQCVCAVLYTVRYITSNQLRGVDSTVCGRDLLELPTPLL